MTEETTIKIAIADDHQIIIDGIKALLEDEKDLEIVIEARNGQELLEKLKEHMVNLVLLDISMPIMDGIQTAKILLKEYPEIKILILSTHDDRRLIHEIWKMGIESYIVKSSSKDEMIKAIKIIYNDGSYFSKEIKDKLRKMPNTTEITTSSIHPFSLTKREVQILKLLVMEYTGNEIAKELHISKNTVETHRKNLFRKTKSKSTIGLVKYAMKHDII